MKPNVSRRTDVFLSAGTLALVSLSLAGLALTGTLGEFGAWAWERHHNILSWYVRPLFLIPFCFFAYRRNLFGITLTLVALATSMFWFPAPEGDPGPAVREILALEREYLFGGWTPAKVFFALLVPLSFAGLALAFWKRSLMWGLAVINAMVLTKILWTFIFTPGQGAVLHLAPALLGLAICNVVILYFVRRVRKGRPPRSSSEAGPA
jgi:hypothetical protein